MFDVGFLPDEGNLQILLLLQDEGFLHHVFELGVWFHHWGYINIWISYLNLILNICGLWI